MKIELINANGAVDVRQITARKLTSELVREIRDAENLDRSGDHRVVGVRKAKR